MSFRQVKLESELDTAHNDWKLASQGSISEEDSAFFNSHITPSAFQKVLLLPQSLMYLLQVSTQMYCHTPIFMYNEDTECFEKLENKTTRKKYEPYFTVTKLCMEHNGMTQKKQISGRDPFETKQYTNISMMFSKYGKNVGYFVYYIHSHPEVLGSETMFLFYHKILKRCCYVITPSNTDATRHILSKYFSKVSIILPFHKLCAACGRCSEDLMDCSSCKVTRYCNKECQIAHWHGAHKLICQKRKERLDQQMKKLQGLGVDFTRKFLSVWKARHSFPARLNGEESEVSTGMTMVNLEGCSYHNDDKTSDAESVD